MCQRQKIPKKKQFYILSVTSHRSQKLFSVPALPYFALGLWHQTALMSLPVAASCDCFPPGDPGEPGRPAAQFAPHPAGHRQPAVRSPTSDGFACSETCRSLSPSPPSLPPPSRLTLGLFFLFTVLHLFSNYKAVSSVVMETLNESRLSIVLRRYLRDGRVLTPPEANQREPVFFGGRSLSHYYLFYYLLLREATHLI